jgi:hypothetical protein
MPPFRFAARRMGSTDEAVDPPPSTDETFRAVVPARAVLTELARGFLLVHESNPDRAVRFAETFLRERAEAADAPAAAPTPRPSPGRLRFGRTSRGSIDPSNFPPTR